ncbi:MAG: hypothetical protein ABI867_03255 [Kofleriaceae bacterium]
MLGDDESQIASFANSGRDALAEQILGPLGLLSGYRQWADSVGPELYSLTAPTPTSDRSCSCGSWPRTRSTTDTSAVASQMRSTNVATTARGCRDRNESCGGASRALEDLSHEPAQRPPDRMLRTRAMHEIEEEIVEEVFGALAIADDMKCHREHDSRVTIIKGAHCVAIVSSDRLEQLVVGHAACTRVGPKRTDRPIGQSLRGVRSLETHRVECIFAVTDRDYVDVPIGCAMRLLL